MLALLKRAVKHDNPNFLEYTFFIISVCIIPVFDFKV